MSRITAPLLILVLGGALAFQTAARAPYGVDYPGSSLGVDRTGDAVQALASGHVGRFFATQPAIGPVSVLVRAPFAALAGIGHHLVPLPASDHGTPTIVLPKPVFNSQLRLYQFGIFPCLMALVIAAAFGAAALAKRGLPIAIQLLVGALMLALPLWHGAITLGHPDEFLTAGLTVGAVIAALNGRVTTAGILAGLALGSKQWAVLALPAIGLAVPSGMAKKAIAIAVGCYLALMIPMALGNPARFADTLTAPATGSHGFVDSDTIWFRFAPHNDIRVFDGVQKIILPQRRLPHMLESAIHPMIVLIAFGLSLLFALRRRTRDPAAIFELLALIFLLRCMLDPVTNDYYHAAFLASLALYEGFSERRLPVLTLLATAAFLPRFGIDLSEMQKANAFYLAWSVPLAAFLAVSLFSPAAFSSLRWRQPLRPKL